MCSLNATTKEWTYVARFPKQLRPSEEGAWCAATARLFVPLTGIFEKRAFPKIKRNLRRRAGESAGAAKNIREPTELKWVWWNVN